MQRTVDYINGKVIMIDQTRIPAELVTIELSTHEAVADAIVKMKVRGAPAIGVAAALGMALAARNAAAQQGEEFICELEQAAHVLRNTRPTAVNLFWGIEKMLCAAKMAVGDGLPIAEVKQVLDECALAMLDQDEEVCRAIGAHGAELLPDAGHVLTHCNAGALACVSYGTALGVIRGAIELGKRIHVYADETRPRLQGMKLTCFELVSDNIPVTVISDNMAGSLMRKGRIDCVVVGADRIAANGDVANKIGTYPVAVLAHHHGIPFYVAAPGSTIDASLADGRAIPIEERSPSEITDYAGIRIAPPGAVACAPAFDLTEAGLITAIITDRGVHRPPFRFTLSSRAHGGDERR